MRVQNGKGDTVGFIVDGEYVKYYDALKNIDLIENLNLTDDGKIVSEADRATISVRRVNAEIYRERCRKNPLQRTVQSKLERWRKNWNGYVLYLTGARQTGKTTELLKFAYKNYEQIIYVNLAHEENAKDFQELVLPNSVRFGMIKYCRRAGLEEFCDSGDTILIIDEIQENAAIYNSIRALQEELKCDVAVTGSYLGKTLNAGYFKPAGNMYEIEMLPLSFMEFCMAYNREGLLKTIDLYGGSDGEEYKILTELYKVYGRIGGYPAVVSQYQRTSSVEDCYEVIRTIISRYTEESASYFTDDKCAAVFENVYKAAFINMSKEKKGTASKDIQDITEFVKSDTGEHVSRKEINRAIAWLKYSKILGSCDLYNQGNVNELLPERRFYFMDCGIARYVASLTSVNNETVEGVLAENFVYAELYRLYGDRRLKGDRPCCSVCENYELDFMLVDARDRKYGIEVKSKHSDKHDSLDYYLERHFVDEAYVAEITRGGIGKKVCTIPIYTVGCRFPYESTDGACFMT